MIDQPCCFLGHREINETQELTQQLYYIIEDLIKNKGVDNFLFGSKSRFNSLCYETVCRLKDKHPHIKRIYVRAEFSQIDKEYTEYLLQKYEDTYFPDEALSAMRYAYIKRNCHMINKSMYCIFYYRKEYLPKGRNSGTKIALDYANKKGKQIIIV